MPTARQTRDQNHSAGAVGNRRRLRVQPLEDRLAPAFVPLGAEFQVNTWTTGSQFNKAIAMDAVGNFAIVFESSVQDGSGEGVYGQRFDANGFPLGNEFRVNSVTNGHQRYSSIAMHSSGSFVVAWEGVDGSSSGIFAQRYNSAGVPQSGEFRVNVFTNGRQGLPSVTIDANGKFVVSWFSVGQDGSGEGVYGRRYDANGNALGTEFRVNEFTTGHQANPRIANDGAGNFVIAWVSEAQDDNDPNGAGVYFRQYDSAGSPLGGEILANTYTTGFQSEPTVAMDTDGDFVVAWISTGQDGSGYGVYGQRFNAGGTKQGNEFRVNGVTFGGQARPSIAMDATGNFAIAWHSDGGDENNRGILARRYEANGKPFGDEFVVNATTINHQSRPRIAMDSQGDSVIVWDSLAQDGDSYGIYAQRYGYRNVAPTFVKGSDELIGVNAGPQIVANWATSISPGPADESNQTVMFEVVGNSNPALFAVAPTISSNGTLTYTPAANLYGTATIQVRLRDDGGTANGGTDVSAIETFSITLLPPPQVSSIQVNGGAVQRSRVNGLTVTFDGIVNIVGAPTSVFQVNRVGGGVVLLGIASSVIDSKSVVAMTFSGAETEFGSLRDGQYELVIAGMQIVDQVGQALVGNQPSGNNYQYVFHRLFGDADGNGTVTATDFNAFRLAYGTGGLSIFDFDNDGSVSAVDFNQFRLRYGVMI